MTVNPKAGIWLIPAATWLILCAVLYPSTGLLQPLLFTPDAVHAQKVRAYLEEEQIPYLIQGAYNILVGSKIHERTAGALAQRGLLGLNKGARLFGLANHPLEVSLSDALQKSSPKIDQALVAFAPNVQSLSTDVSAHAYIRVVTNRPLKAFEVERLHQLTSSFAPSLAEHQITVRAVLAQSLHSSDRQNGLLTLADDAQLGDAQ